jgi:hypothetical protein
MVAFSHKTFNEAGYASRGFLQDENDFCPSDQCFTSSYTLSGRSGAHVLAPDTRRILWGLSCAILILTTVFTFSRGAFVASSQ